MASGKQAIEAGAQHSAAIAATQRIIGQQLLKQAAHVSIARTKLDPHAFQAMLGGVGLSVDSAELLIRLARRIDHSEAIDQLAPGAMLLLAGEEVPAAVIDAALLRARRGELVTPDVVGRLLREHAAVATPASPSAAAPG